MNYLKKLLVGAVGVAALAVGGAAIADAASSHTSTTTTTTTTTSSTPGPPSCPGHGTAAHESAETPVTGAAADKAKAAALKAVGGGTAGDVTTDYRGTGYEVTVTTSDGRTVEVHLDSSFTVLQGPRGHGGPPPGPPPWAPPGA